MRDSKGITEEQMKEYKQSFNHFDKVENSCVLAYFLLWLWRSLVSRDDFVSKVNFECLFGCKIGC